MMELLFLLFGYLAIFSGFDWEFDRESVGEVASVSLPAAGLIIISLSADQFPSLVSLHGTFLPQSDTA